MALNKMCPVYSLLKLIPMHDTSVKPDVAKRKHKIVPQASAPLQITQYKNPMPFKDPGNVFSGQQEGNCTQPSNTHSKRAENELTHINGFMNRPRAVIEFTQFYFGQGPPFVVVFFFLFLSLTDVLWTQFSIFPQCSWGRGIKELDHPAPSPHMTCCSCLLLVQ